LTARGGFSLTQYDTDLSHVLSVHASMPGGVSQSAASCERQSLVVANLCVSDNFDAFVVSDCKGAMPLINDNEVVRLGCTEYAGLAREMWKDGLRVKKARWVKAHNDLPNPIDPSNPVHVDIFCNDKADALAKQASTSHSITPDWIVVFKAELRKAKHFLIGIVKMLDLFAEHDQHLRLSGRKQIPKRIKVRSPHDFKWSVNRWVCTNCLKTKRSVKSFVDDQPCIGFSPPFLKLLRADLGHRLFVTIYNGLPLVFCNICGYYASSKPKCLLEQCPGQVKNAEALKRLNSHNPRHPARNCFLPRPFPVSHMSLSSFQAFCHPNWVSWT